MKRFLNGALPCSGLMRAVKKGKGIEKILKRQLTKRLGPLPAWVIEKFQTADSARLEIWAERILYANSLEIIFEPDSSAT